MATTDKNNIIDQLSIQISLLKIGVTTQHPFIYLNKCASGWNVAD